MMVNIPAKMPVQSPKLTLEKNLIRFKGIFILEIRKMKMMKSLNPAYLFAFTLLAGTATTANAAALSKTLVNPDFPQPASQFQQPAFTPTSVGSSNIISISEGNWRYGLTYMYGQAGWKITAYKATRIHPSNEQPVAWSTLQKNNYVTTDTSCPTPRPKISSNSSSSAQPDGCTNGYPDPSKDPPPTADPGKGGKGTITYPPQGGWVVTITWVSEPVVVNGVIVGYEWVPIKVVEVPE